MNIFGVNSQLSDIVSEAMEYASENGGVIPDDLAVEIDALELSLADKQNAYVAIIRQTEADVVTIRDEMNRLMGLRNRAEKKAEWLRSALSSTVPPNGIKTPLYMLSWRNSESVVFDESVDLSELRKTDIDGLISEMTIYSPDKKAIKDAINRGLPITWAHIETKQNLQVK